MLFRLVWLGAFLGLLLLGLLLLGFLLWQVQQPLSVAKDQTLRVEPGSNLTKVANYLGQEGMLELPRLLVIYARLSNQQGIQAGEYHIVQGDSPKSLLVKLSRGEVVTYRIVFPEGLTYRDWLARLRAEEKLVHVKPESLPGPGLPTASPEGWFFPDTYTFSTADSEQDILRTAHQRMQRVLDEEWQQRQTGLPYETPYEALIMASIIEKETGVANERREIAGVFARRLQKNMRLQTDPTVIYGLGEAFTGNLTKQHLKQDTPYNTYRRRGLPPTPIAMPGRAAINAALNPAEGDALYFVAKGDGTHHFSATLEEHLAAVRRYQLRRTKDYRSSPADTR